MKTITTAIGHLGDSDVLNQDVVAKVEEYVCYVYGVHNLSSVSDARLHLFRKFYAPETESDPLKKIKASDPAYHTLPTGS